MAGRSPFFGKTLRGELPIRPLGLSLVTEPNRSGSLTTTALRAGLLRRAPTELLPIRNAKTIAFTDGF